HSPRRLAGRPFDAHLNERPSLRAADTEISQFEPQRVQPDPKRLDEILGEHKKKRGPAFARFTGPESSPGTARVKLGRLSTRSSARRARLTPGARRSARGHGRCTRARRTLRSRPARPLDEQEPHAAQRAPRYRPL